MTLGLYRLDTQQLRQLLVHFDLTPQSDKNQGRDRERVEKKSGRNRENASTLSGRNYLLRESPAFRRGRESTQ